MKINNLFKNHKKQFIIIIIPATILVIGVVVWFWFFKKEDSNDFPFGGMGGMNGFTVTEDMVVASGVTGVGITEESFEVENMTTELEIEEVYISSDAEVQAGDRILKLSEESIAEAREELEDAFRTADLAYRAGAIEYEQSKITAEYERDTDLLAGEQAAEIYEETVAGLQAEVDRAKEELSEVKEQIAEYESYVTDGTYREYFRVDEYQQIYDENLELLKDKMDEWGVSWSQVVSGSGQGGMQGNSSMMGSVSGSDAGGAVAGNDKQQVLSSFYSVLEKNLQDLEQAESEYEDAVQNASFELQTLKLKLPDLEQAVIDAEQNYETQILQAKLTYEKALAGADSADSDYDTNMQKAESDYESLLSDWTDAKENLELFESSVGDGYFYASGSGSVLRMMVRAGQNLTSEAVVFVYSNPEEMTVTVSVDQSDIAKIALGDEAYIQSTEFGGFEGEVTEINPVSSSTSRTSITYNVTLKIVGETGDLTANESVTVIFGMTMEEMEQNSKPQGEMPGGDMPQGEMPQGEMPNGEMPQGEMPQGEMPQGEMSQGEMPQGEMSQGDMPEMPDAGEQMQRPEGKLNEEEE